ncbi:MAG: type IV-A pilus assembly ATPase PilB, partial [Pseudomonadota bacterium]
MAVSSANASGLGGLPRRLIQDGIVDEATLTEAVQTAKEKHMTLVGYLVEHQLADSRDLAIAASSEFGVPLLDLDAMEVDVKTVQQIPENLLTKHRVLPLLKRGTKRLFVAISDPTNLAAIDEIKFAAACSVEAVVVEDDKLQEHLSKALEAADSSSILPAGDDDLDLDNLEIDSADEAPDEDTSREDVEDAPIVRFVNKILLDAIQKGASDIHFEPYEKIFRVRTRLDGRYPFRPALRGRQSGSER